VSSYLSEAFAAIRAGDPYRPILVAENVYVPACRCLAALGLDLSSLSAPTAREARGSLLGGRFHHDLLLPRTWGIDSGKESHS
jgi:hypothetical protein